MLVKNIEEQTGSLETLKALLEDEERKIHGVSYTNSFFSQRYLCRQHALVDNINIEDNTVKLTVSTRLERMGLLEIENTLDVLVQHTAGDIPGFTPEGLLPDDEVVDRPFVAEPVGVRQQLFSVDVLLIMEKPTITYQEITIAGSMFTLVNIEHSLDDYFDQTVTLLFGEKDKLYLLSHFFGKELTTEDMRIVLDLIVDENITGKAIHAVKMESESGASWGIFPYDELINSYMTAAGEYVFGNGSGYIRISDKSLEDYKLECVPSGRTGAYRLDMVGSKETIRIFME
jgi:hypothetical protein